MERSIFRQYYGYLKIVMILTLLNKCKEGNHLHYPEIGNTTTVLPLLTGQKVGKNFSTFIKEAPRMQITSMILILIHLFTLKVLGTETGMLKYGYLLQ